MKKFSYTLILFCLFILSSFANTTPPEKIYSITRVKKSLDYYVEQAELWKSQTVLDQQDNDAWFNYYKACRMANLVGAQQPFDLKKIEENIGEAIPNSFEYYHIKYWNDSINTRL